MIEAREAGVMIEAREAGVMIEAREAGVSIKPRVERGFASATLGSGVVERIQPRSGQQTIDSLNTSTSIDESQLA